MTVSSGEFRTKTVSHNSISPATSILLNLNAFTLRSRRKDRLKITTSSSTIISIHILSIVSSNLSPRRAGNCFLIPSHSPTLVPTDYHVNRSLKTIFQLGADCSFVKKFVEIVKWLCSIPTFFEVVEHNMANMNMIFDKHFHYIGRADYFNEKTLKKRLFLKEKSRAKKPSGTSGI